MPRERPVVIAGTRWQADDWCRANGVNPNDAIIVTSDRDAYRLRQHRFTAEDVHRVGTWYENRMVEVAELVGHIVRVEAAAWQQR